MSSSRITAALAAVSLWSVPMIGADLSGGFQLWGGPLEVDGAESNQFDQRYRLELNQEVSQWLRLSLSYRGTDFRTEPEEGAEFERSSSEPRLDITYDRPVMSARVSLFTREIRSSVESQDLDIESSLARLEWRPRTDSRTILLYQEDSNVADSSVFGRDTDSTLLDLTTILDREYWSGRYSFHSSSIENNLTTSRFDQDRHELRMNYGRVLLDDRLLLTVDALANRNEQEQSLGGSGLARPIPAREGLFAIDTSPEVGELDITPGLIDGETTAPVAPRIEIGGANTFRNVGVDLGITRTATRIEVTVDAPSSSDLMWGVFSGPDNLNWFPVLVERTEYDEALLRYTMHIPATTDRFFKAVNLSLNTLTDTAVTEIRLLEDVENLTRTEGDATDYRANLFASFDATERVYASLQVSMRSEEDLAGGLLRRQVDEQSYRAGLRFLVRDDLVLRFGYDFSDFSETLEPAFERQDEQLHAALEWDPLEAVAVTLTASSREEKDGEQLIRSSDSVRLNALTALLPQLSLTTDVSFNRSDDPFSGFNQSNWQWRETVESRPTDFWILAGSFTYIRYDSTGDFRISSRVNADVRSTWLVTPFLSLGGQWGFADDDFQETRSQRYSLSWSPGRKLTSSLSYQETETELVRSTAGAGVNLDYRPNRWAKISFNVSRSEFAVFGGAESEIRAARAGVNLFF